MTKAAALQAFFSSFGLNAYPTSAIADDTDIPFPYLTYELVTGALEDGEVGITVNVWFYTSSEAEPNAKAEEISKRIGRGGTSITCDDGIIWIKRGAPFCQSLNDSENASVKRRYINITLEYLTL